MKSRRMMQILAFLVVWLLRIIIFVFDTVTFLPYFLLTKRLRSIATKRVKGRSTSDSAAGPYRSVDHMDSLATSLFPECKTNVDLFERALRIFPDKQLLGTRVCLFESDEVQRNGKVFKKAIYGDYEWQTYADVYARVTNFGSGLAAIGHQPKEIFVLFAETCADWIVAAEGAFMYNFPFSTLYATLGDDSLVHMINETEAKRIVTTAELLPKFKSLLPRIPSVTHIIYMDRYRKVPESPDLPSHVTVMSMTQVENLGRAQGNQPSKPTHEDMALVMYTSGSTAFPKGVMLSHANMLSGIAGLSDRMPQLTPSDTYIGYLPLAHVLELAAEISCLSLGIPIGYSSPQTITDQSTRIKAGSKGDITILRPTVMTCVPLILDRIYKTVWDKMNQGNPVIREVFVFACKYKEFWLRHGFDTPILNRVLFKKVKALLGGRVRHIVSGSAPLNHATQKFMNVTMCMTLTQGYGLTETFGAGCVAEAYDTKTQAVGHPLICSEIYLRNWDEGGYRHTDTPLPRGEVCIGGSNVAMGYFKNPEKTAEDFVTMNGMRYFCTGDIGQINTDGTLSIIDRKKDLVKLQTGEYVSLGKVETALKLCPLVDQICAYAKSTHDYIVCFVVVNAKQMSLLAKELGIENGVALSELCAKVDIQRSALEQIHAFCKKAKLTRYETPMKIKLSTEPWTSEAGLLTEAFKLKRLAICNYYSSSIAEMYA